MNYIKGIRLSSIPYNEYPFNIPAVRHLNKAGGITLDKPVTFLVGENGTGKSTLIEAIAVAMGFNAEGGSRDFYFNTRKTHSDLYEHLQIIKSVRPYDGFFLRAESFYNTASYLEENSTLLRYGGVSFHEQSHGESFLSLVINRFDGNGLYILDEPTTGLHFEDIKVLLGVLQKLVDQGNTVIVIEHNLDVLKSVDHIFDMGPEGGKAGGMIVAAGTPEQLAQDAASVTGPFLKEVL